MYKSLSSEFPSETETVIPDALGSTQLCLHLFLPLRRLLGQVGSACSSDNCSLDWLSCYSWGLEGGLCLCMYLYVCALPPKPSQGLAHLDNSGGLTTLRV